MKFVFHLDDYEIEREYKEAPTDEQINDDFDAWAFQYGYGSDELDDCFDDGTAGYYRAD